MLIGLICVIGNGSCTEKQSLSELPYSKELQEAIDQVWLAYPDYDLGVSAAIIVPGYNTWTGVSGYSQPNVPITKLMLFDIGSIAKNFEAALVLELVRRRPPIFR